MQKWRRDLSEKEMKETAVAIELSTGVPQSKGMWEDAELGMLGDWSVWPQVGDMDFAALFADEQLVWPYDPLMSW